MSTGPFDLNLRHLEAIASIIAHGSMSAAAKVVNLSQPALTQGLAKMERQLGTSLFDRRSDGVTPTPAGSAFATRIAAAFAHLRVAVHATPARGGRGFGLPERLMTATQLHAFLRLAEAGSFVAASRKTRLSQPALHRAVRDLEQICGLAFVERRGRGIQLTRAGRRLERGIRLMAAEIGAGIFDLSGDHADTARIMIGAMPLSRALVLPRAIVRFLDAVPPATIAVIEGSWRELVGPLNDGIIDMMIGALRTPPPDGLDQLPLFEDRLIVVGRAGHPLCALPDPTLDDLAGCRWIIGPPGTPLRAHWEMLFHGRTVPPAPIECGSVMVIRGVLLESDVLTLLSPDQILLEMRSGILVPIGKPIDQGVRMIGVTTRAGWRPTSAQRHFMALLKAAAAETRIPINE